MLTQKDKADIADIVSGLFKNGMTPCQHYGIDVDKIERIELAHPHVNKQYPVAR